MYIVKVEATTKSGRDYVTQFAVDEAEDVISQVDDARQQLEYEIHQLL